MTLNYTTVTGEFADGTGAGLNGYVTFTPSEVVYASGVPVLQPERQVTVQISAGQLGPVALLATDNEGLTVEGRTGFWYWTVQVIIGEALPPWSFFLPSSPATVDLYSLANTPAGGSYLPLPAGSPADGEVPYVTATSPLELGWETPTGGGAVDSVFGRDGAVTAEAGDYTVTQVTGAAPLASPALTGTPAAPTASPLTDDTQIATTAYTDVAVATETSRAETAEALKATMASPVLTGTPTAPTAAPLTTDTQLATTAYADTAVAVETSRAETAEGLKASLVSPALTGTPTAPTQTAGDSTTKLATDAFVSAAVTAETSRAEAAEALALLKANSLSDVASAATARSNLGLGSAAVQAASAFDAAGLAATAQGNAETFATSAVTTETSRAETAEALSLQKASNLSDLASAATARTNLGLGTAAVQPASAFDVAGAAATAQGSAESFTTSSVATETSRAESAEALKAPLASPALTGTPTAPTATALTDSAQLGTTAYTDSAVATETSRAETAEALKAPLASPALTGAPTAPTQTAGDSTTKIATDGFVAAAVTVETSRAETAEALALQKTSNLSDLASAATARTNLGLGSAATQASSAFDAAGAAAAAAAASLPVPSGTAGSGLVPVGTGSGEASKWQPGGGVTILVPAPTGATATDTPAVTAAITALVTALASGPATLLFADGVYQVDSNALVIRSVANFTVRGSGGATITQAPNRAGLVNNITGNLLTIADCTDFRVELLTIDGLRDTVAPITPLTATAASGQPSVTVASGQGARYLAGQHLYLFGGLGTSEQQQSDPSAVGAATTPFTVSSITAGGGAGGGDLITFGANLVYSYTHVAGALLSDGFGPYASSGAYLTPYQAGNATVAGRTLTGEDQQNGLHLVNCKRFSVDKITGRNLWESPIRLGTGYETTSLTDGCQQGTVTRCTGYHAYDQGVAVWNSVNITVAECVENATGWAGVSLTGSDYCAVIGCQIISPIYCVPGDTASGSGVVTEGGLRNQIAKNIIISPEQYGIAASFSPMNWGLNQAALPATSTFLEAGTAAGTSIQVSATATMMAGGKYSLLNGCYTEAITVNVIVDGTHIEIAETLAFSHAAGVPIGARVAQENVVEGNTIRQAAGNGMMLNPSCRGVVKDNTITGCAAAGLSFDYSNGFTPATGYPAGDGVHVEGNVIGGNNGAGIVANGVTRISVRGNTVYGTGNYGGGIELHGVTDSMISQNRITDVIGSYGIVAEAGGSGSTACARLIIAENIIERTTSLPGISVQAADSLAIIGNSVHSCGGVAGIYLQGITRSEITANKAIACHGAGIELDDSGSTYSLYNRVTGNTCRDDGTGYSADTGATQVQQYGIYEANHSASNLYTANECDSNAVSQLYTAGANSYAWANIISGTVAAGTMPPQAGATFTGEIVSETSGGAVSLANNQYGSGLILTGWAGVTAALRIIGTTNAWVDGKDAAYFQIDTAVSGQRNAVFISGTSGTDTQFNRLQFCSLGTTFTDLFYASTPAPAGLVEIVQANDKVGLRIIPVASQVNHLQNWCNSSGTAQAFVDVSGNIDVALAGSGLRVAEGSNAKQGTATLTVGTVTVANTSVTATSRILLTAQDNNSTGTLRVSARTPGTGFTVTSSNAGDSGVVAYQIFEPG